MFNDFIKYLVLHKNELIVFTNNLLSSLKELYHSAIPIDGVAPKDTKLFYKLVGLFLSSDSYKDMVAKVFDTSVQDVSGREYRTGFLLAEFLRGKTVEMGALAKLT